MKITTFNLDESQINALQNAAVANDLSVSQVARRVIDRHFSPAVLAENEELMRESAEIMTALEMLEKMFYLARLNDRQDILDKVSDTRKLVTKWQALHVARSEKNFAEMRVQAATQGAPIE